MMARINVVLNRILDQSQTAYLPGRRVHEGLRLFDLIKVKMKRNKREGYLISLDARKAYDSVSHQFIADTLKAYGFKQEVINIFKVFINGFLTEQINIGRGVKQGDALS